MRRWIGRGTPLALLAVFGLAACGDDDPTSSEIDVGVRTMVLTIGRDSIRYGSDGSVSGSIPSLPLGTVQASTRYLGENGQPVPNITPGPFSLEVFSSDTLAARFTTGTGFSGTITTFAPGPVALTFRLKRGEDVGFQRVATLDVASGIASVRLTVGTQTLVVPAKGALPGRLDPIPVGPAQVRAEFLDENGRPASAITPGSFSFAVNSSDTQVVTFTPGSTFAGTLRGVTPGIASVAFRLRSMANSSITFQHVVTVFVQ